MATIDKYNIGKLFEESLKAKLQEAVTKEIVNQMVAEFEQKARERVKAETEKIVIDTADVMSNHAYMYDEIRVYLKWSDGNII